MKNVEVSGVIEFMGKEMPNLYGGFGVEQKVILAKTIAEIHDIELKDINKLINNNFEEFELGIDILDLKGNGSLQSPLDKLGFSNRDISISKHIYLLSEQGYMLLVGFMRTDKAKEIRKQLRRNYFAMKEVIGKNENLLSVEQSLQLQLFSKDPLDVVNAHKQLVDIKIDEVKPTFIEEGGKLDLQKDLMKEKTLQKKVYC
ncbi:MAG: ORF6N domain-containing protein [Bacilli bacterium]